MSFVMMIVGAVALTDLLWWFASARLLRRARAPRWLRVANSVVILLLLGALLVVIGTRRAETAVAVPQFVVSAVYIWHLLIAPLLLPLIFAVGLWAVIWWAAKRLLRSAERSAPAENAIVDRRSFLAAGIALAPPVLCFGLTGIALRQVQSFRIRRFTIPVANLPPTLDGLTIAHVTDLHVGRFTTGPVLKRIASATNDLRADLVLLTGDLINGAAHEIAEAIEAVRRFDARGGIYMVEGNHDLFAGRSEFESRIKGAGIPLLVNEAQTLSLRGHPVQLLGLRWGAPDDDAARPRTSDEAIAAAFERLLALRDEAAFPLFLAHHPHAFDGAVTAGLPLTLAGHTHGGQLMLNEETGFGPMIFRYWSGLYSRGGSHLVVSNGAGNWFPLRTSAPAEIVHLTLQRA